MTLSTTDLGHFGEQLSLDRFRQISNRSSQSYCSSSRAQTRLLPKQAARSRAGDAGGERDGSWNPGSRKRNRELQMNGKKLSRAVLKWNQWQSSGEHDEAWRGGRRGRTVQDRSPLITLKTSIYLFYGSDFPNVGRRLSETKIQIIMSMAERKPSQVSALHFHA